MVDTDDDEPVFILRASDELAPQIVIAWAFDAEQAGVSKETIASARETAHKMFDWQKRHGCKIPT